MEEKMRNFFLEKEINDFLTDCKIAFAKASGKGGQKINKTSVAVLLTHIPTSFTAEDASSRSQAENKIHAAEKLQYLIAEKIREKFSPPAGFDLSVPPSVHNRKRHLLWVALMLDAWAEGGYEPKKTAQIVQISVSRLTKIASHDTFLWQCINRARNQAGLHSLKGN